MKPLAPVLDHIDPDRLLKLLWDAVAEYSPTYNEGPALDVFIAALTEANLAFERDVVGDPEDERFNLWIQLGPDPVELVWVGHVDTVVRQDRGEIGPERDGDQLYGLGSADMKSGCAAAVEGLIALKEAGVALQRGVAVALVVGEEEYGDGAEALLPRLKDRPLVVIGEPTGLRLCNEHFGYLEMRWTTGGTQVHAALPQTGDNAIHAMLSWLQRAIEITASPDNDHVRVNPRQILGGSPMFIVPAECEATVDFHVRPGGGLEPPQALTEAAAAVAAEAHPGCTFRHEDLFWAPGFRLEADDARIAQLRNAFELAGVELRDDAFPSHSDGSLLFHAGCPTVICGPGRLEVAHTHDEHVSIQQTVDAARLYAAMFALTAAAR